jgi:enamine deaminase RidA (YjgF/YER057c/UK114 family)
MQRTVLGRSSASYSSGLIVEGGRLVFISGQLPLSEGKLVGENDFDAQVRATFANIQRLLNQAGGGLGNVVKITAFLTTLEHYPRYNAIRGELFAPNFPTSSAVQVAGLVVPGAMIEIEAIAVLD